MHGHTSSDDTAPATEASADGTPVDVLVVGAGPTGLTLACDLARRGVRHRILERGAAVSAASRAKTLQPRALEVLDDLGAVARVLERGVTELPVRFHGPDGSVRDASGIAVRVSAPRGTPFPDPLWIGEPEVEAALRQQHQRWGGVVELASEVVGLTQDDRGVSVQVTTARGEAEVRARWVVGADGGRSRVRRLAGLALVGETHADQRWYLGDVLAEGLARDRIHIWTSADGMLGLTPLPGTDVWQLQSPVPTDLEDPPAPSLELYQAMLDQRAGPAAVVLTRASWLSVYRVNVRMAERYRSGRVLLAGYAAHVHSPAGGQGMNTGIQDAHNLGWKLAAVLRGAGEDLLDTYGEERIPVARAVLDDSTSKMRRTLRTTSGGGGRLGAALGALSDDLTSGLTIAYPTSSLTLPHDPPPGHEPEDGSVSALPPGHRAPDAAGLRGGGEDRSVFDLLRGPHWTLLAFTDGVLSAVLRAHEGEHLHVHQLTRETGVAGRLQDTSGAVHDAYATRGEELVLVRPDGYLSARVPAGDQARLAGFLDDFRLDPDAGPAVVPEPPAPPRPVYHTSHT